MPHLSWKTRLAVVLSAIWFLIALAIAGTEKNTLAIIGVLGVLPLAFVWGIAWVWLGYRKQRILTGNVGEVAKPESTARNGGKTAPIRIMNAFGAVGWTLLGIALLFNKMDELSARWLLGIFVAYVLIASIPAGTAWALSTSASERWKTAMLRGNWALIGLWLFGSAGNFALSTNLESGSLWGMVGGVFIFGLPAWLNIRALKSNSITAATNIIQGPINKWLYAGFLIASCSGLALYLGLFVRAIYSDHGVAHALGAVTIPVIICIAAIRMRNARSSNFGLLAGTTIAVLIAIGGVTTWRNISITQEIADVAQSNLDAARRTLESESAQTPKSDVDGQAKSVESPPQPHPSRPLTKNEELAFMSELVRESFERQGQNNTALAAEISRLDLISMWHAKNLFSLNGLRESQVKIASYKRIVEKARSDYNNEIALQDQKVLVTGGPKMLEEFRLGRTKNVNDTVSIYEFELSNIETVIQLFSFLETKVRQGTAEVRGDQAIFSAASDGVIYDSLITKITENQNKLEALQKIALERRQQGIDKLRRSVGRN
jgi:hypothetical protein